LNLALYLVLANKVVFGARLCLVADTDYN
jgi:hypothetical protein